MNVIFNVPASRTLTSIKFCLFEFFAVAVAQIIPNEVPVLGRSSYALTCKVFVTDNLCPKITYQWTKNNGTVVQLDIRSNTLSIISPLRLSDASVYTCYVTVSSLSLNSSITVMASHDVRFQSE